jgi:hypothetical protein
LLVSGCRTTEIYNVPRHSVPGDASRTLEETGRLIEDAAVELGWEVEHVAPGEIIATLDIRRHRAVVSITYGASHYAIRYKDSDRLLYDGGKIHRNYNHWIRNLEQRIHRALVGSDPSSP